MDRKSQGEMDTRNNSTDANPSGFLPVVQVSDQDASALFQLHKQLFDLDRRQASLDQERREIIERYISRSADPGSKISLPLLLGSILYRS